MHEERNTSGLEDCNEEPEMNLTYLICCSFLGFGKGIYDRPRPEQYSAAFHFSDYIEFALIDFFIWLAPESFRTASI